MKSFKFTFFSLLFSLSCFAQNLRKIDSLHLLIKTSTDTGKIRKYLLISKLYLDSQPDSSLKYSNIALDFSTRLDQKPRIIESYVSLGNIYKRFGKFDKADQLYQSNLELNQKINDKGGIANAYLFLSSNSFDRNRFDLAVEYSRKALKIAEELKSKDQMAMAYGNIGNGYIRFGDYPNAVSNFLLAQKIMEELNNKNALVALYGNIGTIYFLQGKQMDAKSYYLKSLKMAEELDLQTGIASALENIGLCYDAAKKPSEALTYYLKTLEIQKKIQDQTGIGRSYETIGSCYSNLGNNQLALEYLKKAIEIFEQSGDKLALSEIYGTIGIVSEKSKDFKKALEYQKKALAYATEINYAEVKKNIYASLATINKALGNYKDALNYQEMHMQLKDSMLNKEDFEKVASMKANFEMEKKEKENELITKAKDAEQSAALYKQKVISISASIGGGLILLVALIALRAYNQKKKVSEQVLKQKEQIEEKNKDITDSINYAKRIQRGFLPSEQAMKDAFRDNFVLYMPKDIVSGDFYWLACVHTTRKDSTPLKVSVLTVADCTGHGVPGALMSIVGKTLLNQTIRNPDINSPADALNFLNTELPKNIKTQQKESAIHDGMDMSMCAFDLSANKMFFAGANNPVYIVRNGELIEIKGEKQPISSSDIYEKIKFTDKQFSLQHDDMVYMFTDGYADQFGGPDAKKFKYKQLKEVLLSVADKNPAEQGTLLKKQFEDWKGNLDQVDDICIIGVRI